MATRSYIGIKTAKGTKSVYSHWNGYPSNNGKLLLENYNTTEKVEALIVLGDISALRETIDCPKGHSFNTPKDDCTIFYGRDRGETGTEPVETHSAKSMRSEAYDYLFDPKLEIWYYRSGGRNWVELTPEVCEI